jgi:hypothetical protein
MPSSNMMSNSACRNGGATLFFTAFTLRVPDHHLALFHRRDATHVGRTNE